MPRDRPRQLPDQTGSLGAVHPRPLPPRALRPRLRSRMEGTPAPRRDWEAPPPQSTGPKTPTGTGRSRCGRLVFRRPICPN
jgi:hypothetical protein